MDFLNIGTGEFLLILLLAILLVGPRRAVEMAQQAGQLFARLRKELLTVQRSVVTEVEALKQEALKEVEAVKRETLKEVEAIKQEVLAEETLDEMKAIGREAQAEIEALKQSVQAEPRQRTPGKGPASPDAAAPGEDRTE